MKPFCELTYKGQLRRLRILARSALEAFGLQGSTLTFIHHGENTTFRVDLPDGSEVSQGQGAERDIYVINRYVLRIHRHGYQNEESVGSELDWLDTLFNDTSLAVPQPLRTTGGRKTAVVDIPGVPEPRVCSVLRWLKGRFHESNPRETHFREMGRTMAQLHNHAESWRQPAGFSRRHWDWDGLFGDNAGFHLKSKDVWALLSDELRSPFRKAAEQTRDIFHEIGGAPDVYGLIHADLHLGNLFFHKGRASVFDFDDCGFGHLLYDIVVPISECMENGNWQVLSRGFLDGYSEHRVLPNRYSEYLDAFLAARRTSLALWATDIAQINDGYRDGLKRWIPWLGEHVRNYVNGERHLMNL